MIGHRRQIADRKALKRLRAYFPDTKLSPEEFLHFRGIYRKTGKPCSCYMCGNPRKYFNMPTLQERRAEKVDGC